MKLHALACIALLAVLAADAPASAASTQWTSVAFEMNSWGQPVVSWTVVQGGGGSWTETTRAGNSQFGPYSRVVHALEAGDDGYGQLLGVLGQLPDPAPDYDSCKETMTDMAYGTLRLTRGSTTTEIAWNAGCMDKAYTAFLDTLGAANKLVGEWGRKGKVLRTEKHDAN